MNGVKSRLIACFQAVFPELPESELSTATQDQVKGWDSLAMIKLVNVVEEEFSVQLDLEQLDQLNSFENLQRHLQECGRPS